MYKRTWVLNDVGQLPYQKYWEYPKIEKLTPTQYFKYMDLIGIIGVQIIQCKPFVLKMLSVRGYNVTIDHDEQITQWVFNNVTNDYSDLSCTFKFEHSSSSNTINIIEKNHQQKKCLENIDEEETFADSSFSNLHLIFYLDSNGFGVEIARNLIFYMHENKIEHCLIISKCAPTSQVLKEINNNQNLKIEIWQIDDFLYDWTNVGWVPLHHVMSKKQADYFLKINNYKSTDLPKLQSYDIMAKYHGLKKNQIICIQKTEPNIHAYFRIVE